MSKIHRSVVLVERYARAKVGQIERHNERKNESYSNSDVVTDRTDMNVHFKKCDGTYLQAFDNMVANGEIHLKHLKKDGSSEIINELIYDVNTDYFEEMGEQLGIGGYEYAKQYFAEAYRQAVQEAGGEQYILSAVMHADEINVAATEKYGRDTYHYHLHVVFIPVVDKEVKWTKRCKDPALVGTVKEVIKQVSSSKKWLSEYEEDENGKRKMIYSYSKLQDRYHNHMKSAGFKGFERGEKGSTAEHLDVLDFKIKQDTARAELLATEVKQQQETADTLTAVVEEKQTAAVKLDKKTEKKQKELIALDKQTRTKEAEAATFTEIDAMAKSSMLSANLQISPADWKKIKALAKEGIKAKGSATIASDVV